MDFTRHITKIALMAVLLIIGTMSVMTSAEARTGEEYYLPEGINCMPETLAALGSNLVYIDYDCNPSERNWVEVQRDEVPDYIERFWTSQKARTSHAPLYLQRIRVVPPVPSTAGGCRSSDKQSVKDAASEVKATGEATTKVTLRSRGYCSRQSAERAELRSSRRIYEYGAMLYYDPETGKTHTITGLNELEKGYYVEKGPYPGEPGF